MKARQDIKEKISVKITYLEAIKPPPGNPPAPPAGKVALMVADDMPLSYYRYLFDAVGRPHKWVSRRYLDDEDLARRINALGVRIYVLYKDGWPAGYAELNLSDPTDIDFKFFGLVPEAQGYGLGPWFFHEVLMMAWASGPKRVQIETCTLDNPAALRLYQKMGFSVYDQADGIVVWRG
ncbi:GNAT family N-acetyltransferase [Parvularcula sp. LCG005]|uniref:GNAT family N-acetyltransferase n=1 Tax=Parvularcula sp. LCG005 TaxID=3078805 RepID=UPI002943EF02|nr:GNAT family N-acetyltransferase [Parvularcula sp. LCG005]WOI54663.1 GNAT family N-acetyltransferase [Parvularcula sp. LCG005]